MEKIKSIGFKLTLKGNGVVNYDSNEQKSFLFNHCGYSIDEIGSFKNNNVSLAKKAFVRLDKPIPVMYDEDGNVTRYKDTECYLKISSDCLRKAVFDNDIIIQDPKVMLSQEQLAYYATSIHSILRGYVNITGTKDNMIAKKSGLCLTSAIDYNAKPYIEFHANSIPKTKKEEEDEDGSTTLFKVENVGDTCYTAKGFISLRELQFMSCDMTMGNTRISLLTKWMEGKKPIANEMFLKHYGYIPYTYGYYSASLATLGNKIGELGVKFEKKFVIFLVKELIKRIMSINIKRARAYASVSEMKIKFITDNCLNANLDDDSNYITLNNEFIDNLEEELDKRNLDIFDFYTKLNEDEVIATRKENEEIEKKIKEDKKAENERKRKENEKRKAEKARLNNNKKEEE